MKKKMYELLYWRNISTIYIFKTNYKWQVVISKKKIIIIISMVSLN